MAPRNNTVIRGGRILDVAGHTLRAADILVQEDRIGEIGMPGMPAPSEATSIDAAGKMLIPGLINAHTHAHGNLARGSGDRWTLELLLNAGPWLSGNRTLEDAYLSALIGAVEMVQKGCTACYDLVLELPVPTPAGLEAVAHAYRDVGMRAVIAPMMADRTLYEAIPGLRAAVPDDLRPHADRFGLPGWEQSLAAAAEAIHGWKYPGDEARLALAPTIPLHCSDEFLRACRRLAAETGVGLHMHLAESRTQAVSGAARYGKSLSAHLDHLGILGSDFTAAHAIWLDGDDIARLADRGVSVAHNPGSNLRLGSGIAPVRAMRERSLNVGIGTDGTSCSDNLNMFEAMRLASFVSRLGVPDPGRWLTTDEVLTMATAGSARALGFDALVGRIAPGYKADIVFLDLGHINYIPLNDPTNQVVHAEDGSAVDSVMIGGRLVVDRRRLTTIDTSQLAARVEEAVTRLRSLNAEARARAEQLEPALTGFCLGLAGAR
jgi:5-methylthioadenosine/S-adenosylhomocysteine deaminase